MLLRYSGKHWKYNSNPGMQNSCPCDVVNTLGTGTKEQGASKCKTFPGVGNPGSNLSFS